MVRVACAVDTLVSWINLRKLDCLGSGNRSRSLQPTKEPRLDLPSKSLHFDASYRLLYKIQSSSIEAMALTSKDSITRKMRPTNSHAISRRHESGRRSFESAAMSRPMGSRGESIRRRDITSVSHGRMKTSPSKALVKATLSLKRNLKSFLKEQKRARRVAEKPYSGDIKNRCPVLIVN